MIRYSLKCAQSHGFDSWFHSASAFDTLQKAGHISCPECGSAKIEKSLMAPQVRPARSAAGTKATEPKPSDAGRLSEPQTDAERTMAELRRKVEQNSEYVGMNFAAEARAMHDGDSPERSIYGEARIDEARKLLEDGVPVAPLPFMPQRNTN